MSSLRVSRNSARRLPCPAPAFLLFLFIAGCIPAGTNTVTRPAPGTTQPGAERITPADPPAPGENTLPPSPAPPDSPAYELQGQEYWEVMTLGGVRVGRSHYKVEEIAEGDQQLVRTTAESELVVQRAGQTIRPKITLICWDTPRGELVRFETVQDAGGAVKRTVGRVTGDELVIESGEGDKTDKASFAWKKSYRGLFGIEQALRSRPLQPGEKRVVTAFAPLINLPADTELTAIDYEMIDLPDGPKKLLKLSAVTMPESASRIESTIWVDDEGEPLQSYIAGMKQMTQRASKAVALAENQGEPKLDLITQSVVPLKQPLPRPQETKRVVYRARVKEGKIDGLFVQGLSQRVKSIDSQTAEVEVLSVDSSTPLPPGLANPPPSPQDSAPNTLIQSDDPRIQRMAMGAGRFDEPVRLASAIESRVNQMIRKKDFSQAFASAAETAKNMEGDCTEHSVLLAALARARKLPARTAIGLVYYPPKQGFAYHMWNEVWIKDRWLPFDGTIGRGRVAADRLKLVDTNLQGASAYSAMLPVVRAFGRLELEVVSAE